MMFYPFQHPKKIFFIQLVSTCALIFIVTCLSGVVTGSSVLLGVVVAVLPHLVFQQTIFLPSKSAARSVITKIGLAMLGKLLCLILLFGLAMQWQALDLLPFFSAFLIMQFVCWGNYLGCLWAGNTP